MNKYIVSVMIPHIPEDVRAQIIQQEMARVKELKEQKIVDQLMVGEESKNAWMIINANTKDEVQTIMESLPIFPYLYIDQTIQLRNESNEKSSNTSA